MRVGIQTIHAAYNVGAMLQAYATAKAIGKLGHQPLLIDLYSRSEEQSNTLRFFPGSPKKMLHVLDGLLHPATRRRLNNFYRFRSKMPLSQRYYTYEELQKNPPECDIYLSGSDQIWNISQGVVPAFFLQYVPKEKSKVSYASSFGKDSFSKEDMRIIGKLLQDYRQIGVRESTGIQIVREACGKTATLNLDPTFLLSGTEWSQLADQADEHSRIMRPYWYLAQLEYTQQNNQNIELLNRQMKIKGVEYSNKILNPRKGVDTLYDAGPFEMMNLIRNAEFILTSSFHTMAFAIHFRKPFFVVLHSNGRNSRMESLLNQLGISDRIGKSLPAHLEPIDYVAVEAKLSPILESSQKYLASILTE